MHRQLIRSVKNAILITTILLPFNHQWRILASSDFDHVISWHNPGPVQLSWDHCFPYEVPVMESWAGAWEWDYSLSTQCESESSLPMIIALEVVNLWPNFVLVRRMPSICSCYTCAPSYVQSTITTTSQRIRISTTEVSFAKICKFGA